MTGNRNALWIAVIGAVIVIVVAYMLGRPRTDGASVPAGAPAISDVGPGNAPTLPVNNAFPNDPPLAIAVPVLPPDPNATAAQVAPAEPPVTPPPATEPPATESPAAAPSMTPPSDAPAAPPASEN
jgi:hypothetical protein